MTSRTKLWWLWIVSAVVLTAVLGYIMLAEHMDKTIFMPGELSNGHHQLAQACDACHMDAFGGGEVLQKACVDCHGDQRVKPLDSHPAAKFKDPRNADLLENIDALHCVSCHSEHKGEITLKDGLTQPLDFCVYCHSDIGEDRESHKDMAFDTCKNSGCHNFHNNRALYTKYLQKHLHEPETLAEARVPQREFGSIIDQLAEYPIDRYPLQALTLAEIDVELRHSKDEVINNDWLASRHAQAGVNCSACHDADNSTTWNARPQQQACKGCHDVEVSRLMQGKHGMRLQQGLSPMTPAQARLPMRDESAHEKLTCNSCHPAHAYDIHTAAVDACLDCHNDEHSLAYKQSKHFALWQREMSGDLPAGSGVSCATCHMPRINHDINDWMSRVIVDHNQSANLSPNSKMIRSACQNCHGLEFSIDAMADDVLIKNNFTGRPGLHVESMGMAQRDLERHQEETSEQDDDSGMFGF
jgi:hypothetical protein